MEGPVVTQYSNGDDPYAGGQHRGIDVSAAAGTPVVAAADGSVRFAGALGSAGLTVSIRTSDELYDTSYLHLDSIDVRAGDRVAAGARIGSVGTTGRRSLAEPHLHFGVRDAGDRFAYRDPLTLLPPPAAPRVPVARPLPAPLPAPPLPAPPLTSPLPAVTPVAPAEPLAAPAPLPAPSLGPATATARRLHSGTDHARAVASGPAAGPAPAPLHPSHASAPATPTPRRATRGEPTGLDLGWLAACAGLVAAAALLARPRGPAESLRRGSRLAHRTPPRTRAAAAREGTDSIATWPTTSPHRSTT